MNHAREAAHLQGNHGNTVGSSWGDGRMSNFNASMPNFNIQEFERSSSAGNDGSTNASNTIPTKDGSNIIVNVSSLDKGGLGGRRAAGMKKPGRQTYRSSPAERAGMGPSAHQLAAAQASLQNPDSTHQHHQTQQQQVTFSTSSPKTHTLPTSTNTKWAAKKLTDSQRLKRAANATIKAAEAAAGHSLPSLRQKKFPVRLRKKMIKRKRPKQTGVFSTFTLNKDPDCSQYMPYDDVSYPRLQKQASGTDSMAELESMWMVGFLHHNKKTKDDQSAKELQPFLRLPGSDVLPGRIEKDLSRVIERDMVEKKEELTPRFEEDAMGREKRDNRSKMSEKESYRLNELGDELVTKKRKIGKGSGMRFYQAANYKIKRVLRDKKPLKHPPTMKSNLMERMFEVERRETLAASVIQSFWHKYLIMKQMQENFRKGSKIKVIQALVRGMITRKWLALWYKNRFLMIIQWQARCRRYLSNKEVWPLQERDQKAAVKCQKAVRMFLAKCWAHWKRLEVATERIQCMWRGCVARARCDKIWLDKQVTFMQKGARRMMARGKFVEEKMEMDEAAALIERCWRGFWGRRRKNELLYERETEQRQNQTRLLKSEEQFMKDYNFVLKRRLTRLGLEEKNKELGEKVRDMFAYVEEQEFNYTELIKQRDAVSPRAIEQGWVEELNVNIRDHRNWITKYKLECLFDTGLEQRGVEEEYGRRIKQITDADKRRELYSKWREEELEQIWKRQQRLVHEMEDHWKRQKVADERRRWGIQFFKPSGKPDKLRRPGRPWEQTAYAGADRNTFTGGAANLFAYNNDHDKLRVGSNESIDRLMDKLQLQSYHNQVQQYEALLKPLASNMQTAFTGGVDQVAMDPGALQDIGMPAAGDTPRLPTPPAALPDFGDYYENPEDDPYEDPYFKTDEEKKLGSLPDYKTPEERMKERMADKRRSKFRKPISRLPWQLLDELQSEKDRFTEEKALGKLQQMKEMREKEERKKKAKAKEMGLDSDSD
ncbi:hypothetical protein TL16_g05891 [Triparma laevis f. inornata]|uniref:Uncharacterized protein n=1 Tax=Triparma laevis f. inornata TaxID=1714386 RepID=A0A9W7EAZ6_9STRA|nr:hypothetical protein TL16_g05891 [Triparma laevis f. inornata]